METKTFLKSYLVKAVYCWCEDNNLTAYLEIKEDTKNKIPVTVQKELIHSKIAFNLSKKMVKDICFDNNGITFIASISGQPYEIYISYDGVKTIYASEINQGIDFMSFDLHSMMELDKKRKLSLVVDNTK